MKLPVRCDIRQDGVGILRDTDNELLAEIYVGMPQIVKAVNSHDELVALLAAVDTDAKRGVIPCSPGSVITASWLDRLSALISA